MKGCIKQLLDRKLWHDVQAKLKGGKTTQQPEIRMRKPYILKKYLFCSCGAAMTCGASGKLRKDRGLYYYYICSGRNRERIGRKCNTSISKDILEAIVFSALGYIATKGIALGEIKSKSSEYENELREEKKSITIRKSRLELNLRKTVSRFAKMETNESLQSALEGELQKSSREIEAIKTRIENINDELELFARRISLNDIQTKSLMENLDLLQNDLSDSERRELLKAAVEKLVLSVKSRKGFRKDFTLMIFPTTEYMDKIGNMSVEFSMDTSKGKSEWIITSPFELKCQNYGKTFRNPQDRKIKRHWLHQVIKWRREIESGSTQEEIAEKEHLSKSMVCRKLKLLERLSPEMLYAY